MHTTVEGYFWKKGIFHTLYVAKPPKVLQYYFVKNGVIDIDALKHPNIRDPVQVRIARNTAK